MVGAEAAGAVAAGVEHTTPPVGAGTRPVVSMIRTDGLPSGLSLATERMEDARSVCIGFWVGTGSRDEGAGEAGASHFLEHLLFKGTDERSPSAIAEAVDEVGGDFNAFTTKEYTAFYIRLLAEHLPRDWTSSPTSCGGPRSDRPTSTPSVWSSWTRS